MFNAVQRSVYHEINLNDVTNNVAVLRSLCKNPNAGIIGVVKSSAYGHGSVHISKHLKDIGVERLAVATVDEGIYLRTNGITGPIHVLANIQSWDVKACIENNLIPTVSSEAVINNVEDTINNMDCKILDSQDSISTPFGAVNIKIDTGMSRYGCKTDEIAGLVKICEDKGLKVDGIFTHFADSSVDADLTQKQLESFMEVVEPLSSKDIKLHISNSAAIIKGSIGTDLDFVRPGKAIYGIAPVPLKEYFKKHGLKPISALKATPNQMNRFSPGTKVGYGGSYQTSTDEVIGTFALGYADGIQYKLGYDGRNINGYIHRDKTGEKCPIISSIGMDSMSVKLPEGTENEEIFSVITNDYDTDTSPVAIAAKENTVTDEITTALISRYSRVYIKSGQEPVIVKALGPDSY